MSCLSRSEIAEELRDNLGALDHEGVHDAVHVGDSVQRGLVHGVGRLVVVHDQAPCALVQDAFEQGLTLVHYLAQLEPFLTQKRTQKRTLNTPNTPYHPILTPETTPNCTP